MIPSPVCIWLEMFVKSDEKTSVEGECAAFVGEGGQCLFASFAGSAHFFSKENIGLLVKP